jgi:hypothetical protein
MSVTFGTVQLVPAANEATPAPAAGGASPGQAPPPPDPRDLGPILCLLHERAARVRAH